MSEYYEYGAPLDYSHIKPRSTKDEFVGEGWSVRQSEGKFYFEYISGELAGRLKVIEISEQDFERAKSFQTSLTDLCIKYDVF